MEGNNTMQITERDMYMLVMRAVMNQDINSDMIALNILELLEDRGYVVDSDLTDAIANRYYKYASNLLTNILAQLPE